MKRLCIYFVSLLGLLLMLSACRTTGATIQPHATNSKIDTITLVKNHVDSVYLHDSIYIAQKGDTIIKEKFKTLYKYKYIYRDSLHIRIDSIPYPVEVIKQVAYTPKPIKALAGVGGIFLFILALWIGIRVYKAFN